MTCEMVVQLTFFVLNYKKYAIERFAHYVHKVIPMSDALEIHPINLTKAIDYKLKQDHARED